MRRQVAAFDFDGTLTERDTMFGFLASVAGWHQVALGLLAAAPQVRDRDASKARFVRHVLGGRRVDEVAQAGEQYGTHLLDAKIRDDMRTKLEWHRSEGHEIVIVSAGLDVYLDTVGRGLDCATVMCTKLEADDTGTLTGHLVGGNCRGEGKAERLRTYFAGDDVELWAYGDSPGDNEMLAMATHPTRVTRTRTRR